ncbi:MAG: Maf family nucleotide pyrophosphatase [Serpentinimonas sp.]|jgi:septum formation protein|nr:Maf family nucleotide pyrophosphatase [Serpentinimonas sp.]
MAQPPKLYLASQSPRRRELLQQWGLACELLLPEPGEDAEALEALRANESPARYVQRVTGLKLQAAVARLERQSLPPGAILCADTTVALGRQILGKPASRAEAARMLASLSGQMHQVFTAVALAFPTRQGWQFRQALSRSRVTFGPLTAADIRRYVATGEPMGKAGAYAIQGVAAIWVQRISGSYTGIVGLPAHETAQLLQEAGFVLPAAGQ